MTKGIAIVSTAVAALGIAAAARLVLGGSDDGGQHGRPSERADRTALAAIIESHPGSGTFRPYDRLADLLPNVGHHSDLAPQSPPVKITDSVVRGEIVDVQSDRGFIETGTGPKPGRPGAVVTKFDDPAAHWRALRVTVQVDEVLAGPQTSQLTFYLPLMGNADNGEDGVAADRALRTLGDVVILSKAMPDRPEYLGLTRTLPDEPFGVATVGESGELNFPFAGGKADARSAEQFAAGIDTVDELRAAAREAPRNKKN